MRGSTYVWFTVLLFVALRIGLRGRRVDDATDTADAEVPGNDHDDLVAYCLAKPGAVEDQPWEATPWPRSAARSSPSSVATAWASKCGRDADEAAELRHRFPDSVSVMAYIGRHGWNSITLDGKIDDEELRELVDASYDAVVAKLPKRLRPA